MTEPLDWQALVQEAKARRTAEGLTQRALAALAGVSPPTVIAFERGDTRLRLDKVFDVLGALGLVRNAGPATGFEAFVRAARARFAQLTGALDPADPARHPHGHVAFAYRLVQDPAPEPVPLDRLLAILADVGEGDTGWPPFWVPDRPAIRPTRQDGVIECWLGVPEAERAFGDAAHADFWRVTPEAHAYLRRGYQEDGPELLEPGSVFDVTLPIWRAAEVLRHAARLGRALGWSPQAQVQLNARFTGLAGRELLAWARPRRRQLVTGTRRALADTADCSLAASLETIEANLPALLPDLLAPLYLRFDGFVVAQNLVADEIADLDAAGARRRRDAARLARS